MRKYLRIAVLFICDAIIVAVSFYLSFFLRFDGRIPPVYWSVLNSHWYYLLAIKLVVFFFFRLYKSVWRYASIDELLQVALATIVSTGLVVSYMAAFQLTVPRSIYVFSAVFDFLLLSGFRLSYRILRRLRKIDLVGTGDVTRVLIIGAGDAGAIVIREMKNHSQLNRRPVAIIDDNASMTGTRINQVPVVGSRKDIVKTVERLQIDEIILAMPSASKQTIREIIAICKQTDCDLKTVPGVYELIDGNFDINSLRNIRIEDLLGRDVIKLDSSEMGSFLTDKKILVTGGGGSIGSELIRQLAFYKPQEIIIFDIYENNAYDLQIELQNRFKVQLYDYGYNKAPRDFRLRVEIGSVRDPECVDQVMEAVRPDIVFHAAAHKHVPLMEHNPREAIKNNVFGTYNVASAAIRCGVSKFVLISTDKAVNPTNVMGATKRMCEMLVQSLDKTSETEFSLVRFGNVLGSNGSVVPLFKKQIEEQGYITVTHPDIIRYFMTIPEAARLVLQSGAMARGGEIFILDMGEPVKIVDLAKDIIRLSGLEPEVDIPIRFTGLRPGEKLYEELLMSEEGLKSTSIDKIFIGSPLNIDYAQMSKALERLRDCVSNGSDSDAVNLLQELVPTYKPAANGTN
jgi:FlaA1/EpsC-like NDP-sugar epimerase